MVETVEKQVTLTEVEAVIRRLQQTFQCPICLDLMTDPVSTKCDHKFCRLCLLRVLRPRNRAPCPICKESVTKRSLQVLPHWNAIVGKVARLGVAFQRDTGYELSVGGVQEGRGWTERRSIEGEVTRRADSSTEMDATVHDMNKHNSKVTRKRKADEYIGTVVYIEDVSHEATRPSDVKSHINIRSAFPVSRRSKQRKTDDTGDAVDSTTEHGVTRCNRKQEVSVAVGNVSSSAEPAFVDLTNEEIGYDRSKAKYVVVQRVDDDGADDVAVKNGRRETRRSDPGKRRRCGVTTTKESELLACLAEAPLGGVSGNSARARNTRQLRHSVCSGERKERNLSTEKVTKSKVTVRRTSDRVALPKTGRSRKGVANVNDEDIPCDRNLNCDDVREVCLSGTISGDNLTDNDKTPKVSSKVTCWLKTTTDSVSPLSEIAVVSPAIADNKNNDVVSVSVKGISEKLKGVRTRSKGTRNGRMSSCVRSAVDVGETVEQGSVLLKDPGKLVEHVTSVHQTNMVNCESADDAAVICPSPCENVPETLQFVALDEVVPNLDTSCVGKTADRKSCDDAMAPRSASNKRIFRSRLEKITESRPDGATCPDCTTCANDPYLFVASPGTPLRKKRRTTQRSRTKKPIQKRCLDVVINKAACGRKSGDILTQIVESCDEHELGELAEKISEAEEYDLLMSQQFRDMEQVARYAQSTDPASGSGDVDETQQPVSRGHTVGKRDMKRDTSVVPESCHISGVCIVDVHVEADKELKTITAEDEPRVVRDRSGEACGEREQGKGKFGGPTVVKDYSRKCREVKTRSRKEENGVKSTKETLIWSAAMKTARAKPSGQRKGKGRGKRSCLRRKKEETSGTDDEENDAALIVRRDEQVEPSGDVGGKTEDDVELEGGAASLSCVPESTLEAVTDSNQSQTRADSDNNGHRSTSAIEDTQCRNGDLERDDIRCENDLNDRHDDRQVKERTCDVVESDRENDGVLLVPGIRDFEANVDGAIVVIDSDGDELNCSNQTIGFEPMLDFELHVNAEVGRQMAPLEERIACHAHDAESQTAIDDLETMCPYVCPDKGRTYSSEGLNECPKILEKSYKNVEDFGKSPKRIEVLRKSPKSVEIMDKSSKNAETLQKSPSNMEALGKYPKSMGGLRKSVENIEAVDKWPKNLETLEKTRKNLKALDKSPKKMQTGDKSPMNVETVKKSSNNTKIQVKSSKNLETLDNSRMNTDTPEKYPKNLDALINSPINLEAIQKPPKTMRTIEKSHRRMETLKTSPTHMEALEKSSENSDVLENSPINSETPEKSPKNLKTLEKSPRNLKTLEKSPKRTETLEKTHTNMETPERSTKTLKNYPMNLGTPEKSPKNLKTLEKSPTNMETLEQSPEKAKTFTKSPDNEESLEELCTEERDIIALSIDELSSLKSTRKTFSLDSTPLSKGPRDSLELHNILWEAAEMMQDTDGSMDPDHGSMDPDLPEMNSECSSPIIQAQKTVLSAKLDNSRTRSDASSNSTSSTRSSVRKLSLKLSKASKKTSPKLPLDCAGSMGRSCEKSPPDNTSVPRGTVSTNETQSTLSYIVSPTGKDGERKIAEMPTLKVTSQTSNKLSGAGDSTIVTQSTSSDIVSPTGNVGEQNPEMGTRKATTKTSQKPSGSCDSGRLRPRDSVEKPLSEFGKRRKSGRVPRGETGNIPRSDSGSNVVHSIKLSDESESVLTASVVLIKNIANPQMPPRDGSADNLQSDTTFLSSDEIVLGTTDASDDISPPIKVPSAVSINGSKNARKKPREKKASAVVRAEVISSEVDMKNDGHVETLHIVKETYRDEPLSVVMATMSSKSNPSDESETCSSVLLSCIPPTLHDNGVVEQRVNDVHDYVDMNGMQRVNMVHGDGDTRNGMKRVNSIHNDDMRNGTQHVMYTECDTGQSNLGQASEVSGKYSDADESTEDDFAPDFEVGKVVGTAENKTGGEMSSENGGQISEMSHKDLGREEKAEIKRSPSNASHNSDADEFMEEDFVPHFEVGTVVATAENKTGGEMSLKNGGQTSEMSHKDLGCEAKEEIKRSLSNASHNSDADEFMEEDFAPDFEVSDIAATAEKKTGGVMSGENVVQISEMSRKELGCEAKEEVNRSPSNASHETSVVYDKSPILDSLSATNCDSAPRRRICARRSLWSQSSGVSRAESTISTPLIPLVEIRSSDCVNVDDTGRGIVEKGGRRIIPPVKLDSQDVDLENVAGEAEECETRERRNRTTGSRERGEPTSGGSMEGRRVAMSNDADVRYSQMSTVDGDETSQSSEDSDLPDLEPNDKNGFGSDVNIRRGDNVANLSSGSVKGRTSGVQVVRELSSRRLSTVSHDSMNDGSVVRVLDNDEEIVEEIAGNQNRFRGGTSGYHDDLSDEEASCHDDTNSSDSSDAEGDIDSELEASCDKVVYIDREENQSDTDGDVSEENSDASDVDEFVLPTPQKRKPILQVAVELRGDVVDSSDDAESEMSSPDGADACSSTEAKFGDDSAKKGTQNGDVITQNEDVRDVMLHTRLAVDCISTKHTPGKLPVSPGRTPTRSLPVTPGNVSSREEWDRVHKNIDNDMSLAKVGDVTGDEGDDRKEATVVKTEAVIPTDSDEDEEFIILKQQKKKRRSVVELDSNEAETEDTPGGSTCHHSNVTSSSGLSSQSELPITQCKKKLQTEVDNLQDQILQMEAAIAADEGGNHDNRPSSGSHGNTVDRSEMMRCSPASSSGSKRRLRCEKRLSCVTSESLIDRKTSPIHQTSSAQSGIIGSHGDELVTFVDSDSCDDELKTSTVICGNVDEILSQERVGRTGEQKSTALSHSRLSPHGEPGRHSNGVSHEDEESSQSCGSGGGNEVDDLDPDKHMDREMEEGSVEGGDSGVDSDEDLFDMSQEKSCIPQTLSQDDDDLRKTRYVPTLLTSTPRPSFRPDSLAPSREVRTVGDHSCLSTPPGDELKYIEDEDILPSLDVDVEDQCCVRNSPVKTSNVFDTSVNKMDLVKTDLVPSNRGVNKRDYDADGRGRCRTSPNRIETAQTDKTLIGGKVNGGSEDRGRNSGGSVVKESELSDCDIVDDRNSWRSVDVKRNGDGSVREIACTLMDTTRQKQSPCIGIIKIGNKITGKSSPFMMTVASPHGRSRNQTPSPCVANTTDDADFPRRPSWVFIASGISKIDHQPSIDRLVRLLGCRFVSRFSPAVTHILVSAVPPDSLRCPRTLKYFQGVAGGKWVVSVQWVLDSLTARSLRPLADYEISSDTGSDGTHNAPSRARRSVVPLLREYEICCHGSFKDLTRDDICGLAEACGAMTIQESSMFTFDPSKVQVIIVENNAAANMAELQKFRRRYGVALTQKEWLLDSISVYDIQPLEEYAIEGSTSSK